MTAVEAEEFQDVSPLVRLQQALRSHGPTLNLLFEYARAATPEDEAVREAFAGAIASVLHDRLRRFWKDCGAVKHDWKAVGPLIQGYSVPQIISAAAKRNGKKHGLRTNSAWPLLDMLAGSGGYAQIDESIRAYASMLSQARE